MRPYFLMAGLFAGLAALAMLASSLADLGLLTWFNGLRWLRVHFITLGLFAEIVFGLLPQLVAARAAKPKPPMRWDIWFALNGGLLILLIGIPLVHGALIFAGGAFVLLAALRLGIQLFQMRPRAPQWSWKFYIGGTSYLLLGIFLGTGMWLGWAKWLHLDDMREVHIHANIWGFASLVMAGLLIDTYPGFARHPLAWHRSITPIFWTLAASALALIVGPWLESLPLLGAGLFLHLAATFALLLNVIMPLRGDARARSPGFWHLFLAYAWLGLPMLAAPVVALQRAQLPMASAALNAPAGLVYLWLLQYLLALLPFLFMRALFPQTHAELGGSWLSVLTLNLGGVFYWSSIVLEKMQPELEAVAYGLWLIALAAALRALWRAAQTRSTHDDSAQAARAGSADETS